MARIIDLSPDVPVGLAGPHTVAQDVEATVHHKKVPAGTYWQGSSIKIYTHTGAHVDGLLHCRAGGWTTDEITLDQVIGDAVLLDFSYKKGSEGIAVPELTKYESVIRPGDILVLRTDWADKCYGTPEFFTDSPYVTKEGAQWLVDRRPKAVAFDFTQDYCIRDVSYDPRELYCHQGLLGNGIPIIEGIVRLEQIPVGRRFQLYAPFVKLIGLEGSLARVFAILND